MELVQKIMYDAGTNVGEGYETVVVVKGCQLKVVRTNWNAMKSTVGKMMTT